MKQGFNNQPAVSGDEHGSAKNVNFNPAKVRPPLWTALGAMAVDPPPRAQGGARLPLLPIAESLQLGGGGAGILGSALQMLAGHSPVPNLVFGLG